MVQRIFDQTVFRGQGALMTQSLLAGKTWAVDRREEREKPFAVFLRWQLNPSIGLPSEPFKVWRRPAFPLGDEMTINADTFALPPMGHVVRLDKPYVSVSGEVRTGASPATIVVMPMTNGIGFESVLGVLSFDMPANAQRTFTFQAAHITSLWLVGTSSVQNLRGIPFEQVNTIDGWELVETVGFPVDEGAWSDLPSQTHGVKQGLVGAEVDAKTAAAERYARGINPHGWWPTFPGGETAPIWELPSAAQLIKEAEAELLPMLHETMHRAPQDQAAFTREFTIPPPENASGEHLDAEDGTATVAPLTLLQLAVSTDPLQAVVLGFGTGYPYEDLPPIVLGDRSYFNDPNVSDWDYMVTGLWARGLDGQSEPVEYAALIPRPRKVLPPPAPADLAVDFLAHHQPELPDAPWKASARLSWERLPLDNLSSVASFVAARYDKAVAGPATALLERRPSGIGYLPIGNTTNPDDTEPARQSATDDGYPIPNDPGTVNAIYGVATQNIFGVFSPWVTHPFTTTQPDPDLVQITDAVLRPIDTGSGTVCPADLVVDIVVDWRVRSVKQIDLRGCLFKASTRDQPPPPSIPNGLQKSLGGPAVPVAVTFTGDVPALSGGTVICLDPQGTKQVTPGAAEQSQSRRYRLTIPGFSLDYASTPHIGLALQARLREVIAPGRTGVWTPVPKVTYASDPRSRPTEVIDIVQLASLPDASGQCHARISWQAVPGAQGYIVYESNEARMLASRGLSAAPPGTSLSARLTALKDAFRANPDRNDFTRINREPLTGTSCDVTLPRGSQVIHVYVVIPLGAGGTEGPWPSGPDADESLIAYAAPRVAEPAPPRLEVQRISTAGGFAARLRIDTVGSAGARPKRIDVYRTRVADAARTLDSMGPPLAQVTATGGGWTVIEEGTAPDDWIASVRGTDTPGGSWKYVWYRAVAWSEDDPIRGVRGGRSRPSPAVPVLIPPDGPPPLTPLVATWPGGAPGDVLFDFSTSVPVKPTPAGPHTLTAEVTVKGGKALLRETIPLHQLPVTQPSSGSGLWRVDDGLEQSYRLLVRREDVDQAASVTVRVTDPLGRTSEQNYRIEPGPILPLPQISPISWFPVASGGVFYTFSVVAPDDMFGGEPYRVRITLTLATEPGRVATPVPTPLPSHPAPTPVRPRPGPVLDLGTARPRSQFQRVGNTLVYSSPIGDIPTVATGESYSVRRQRIGDSVTITVVAPQRVHSIAVEVTTPDGRIVSAEARG